MLVLIFLLIFSCNNDEKVSKNSLYKDDKKTSDTLFIEITCNNAPKIGLNIVNKFFHYDYVELNCDSNSVATYILKKVIDNQIIKYVGYSVVDGEFTKNKHHYIINKDIQNIKLKYDKGDLFLKNNTSNILVVDDLFNAYDKVNSSSKANKKKIKLIDSLRLEYSQKYNHQNNNILIKLNDDIYYDALQRIEPVNSRIDNYLKNYSGSIIAGDAINNLLYFYIKNRIEDLEFDDIKANENVFSDNYTKLLSIGVFNFLRHEDNKGNNKYQKAFSWLKTTELYKDNSIFIDKEIKPIENTLFKAHLKKLTFFDSSGNTNRIEQIVNLNPSDYYLIDFWATWCAPCIQGVKAMKEMDIPKNLKVISISLDEKKDKEKWIKLTNKLGQPISFWLDNISNDTENFIGLLEMKSIPRYILMDQNFNLIDQAFYHPNEPQFLSKLQDVKNHKYW